MANVQIEQETIIGYLEDSNGYKENFKPYKISIKQGSNEKIRLIIGTVQKVLVDKTRHSPISQLNSIRLVKECIEMLSFDFIDLVEEKLLPIMSQISQFQSENPKLDRGKDYFLCAEHEGIENLEMVGNSFIRLILECLYFWAKWFPHTQFGKSYEILVEQNVVFPQTFSYFKPDSVQIVEDQLLKKQNQKSTKQQALSEIKEIPSKYHHGESSAYNSSNNFQKGSSAQNKNQKGGQGVTAGGDNEEKYESPFVVVNRAVQNIKQIKGTVIEGLSKQEEMDDGLLNYFKQEFQKFASNSQDYSQRLIDDLNMEGAEDLLGNLFNESEFAELFIQHCTAYLNHQTSWSQFQDPFIKHFKKPPPQQNIQKYGESSQTIDYVSIRMQPNMLASDTYQSAIKPKEFNRVPQEQNVQQQLDDENEKTIKVNDEFTQQNKKRKQSADEFEEQKAQHHHQHHNKENSKQQYEQLSELKSVNGELNSKLQEFQPYSQQKRDEFSRYESGRRTLKEAFNKSEHEKYKSQLKSNTNFSKITSVNSSNISNVSMNQKKALINKIGTQREQANNMNNLEGTPEELLARLNEAKNLLENLKTEKDYFIQKYEEAQLEIDEMVNKIARLANNRDKEKN